MNRIIVYALVWLLVNVVPALAGEKVAIECSQPGCGYTKTLSLGGARHAPMITCYCSRCRDFVRLKLKDWSQYRGQEYHCPKCGHVSIPIYSQEDIQQFPCPKCGGVTLKTKTLSRFD